jgi:hypothetical protein
MVPMEVRIVDKASQMRQGFLLRIKAELVDVFYRQVTDNVQVNRLCKEKNQYHKWLLCGVDS